MPAERATRMEALREDAKRIDALLGGVMTRLSREMDEVARRYQKESIEANGERQEKGEFKAMLLPRVKKNAVGMPRVYWERLRVRSKYAKDKGLPRREHISRNRCNEPYPEQKLRRYTDEYDHDVVMEAQREFEHLEALAGTTAKAIHAIKELINGKA